MKTPENFHFYKNHPAISSTVESPGKFSENSHSQFLLQNLTGDFAEIA